MDYVEVIDWSTPEDYHTDLDLTEFETKNISSNQTVSNVENVSDEFSEFDGFKNSETIFESRGWCDNGGCGVDDSIGTRAPFRIGFGVGGGSSAFIPYYDPEAPSFFELMTLPEDSITNDPLCPENLSLSEIDDYFDELGTDFDFSAISDNLLLEAGISSVLQAVSLYGDEAVSLGLSLSTMLSDLGNIQVIIGEVSDSYGHTGGDGNGGFIITIDVDSITSDFAGQTQRLIAKTIGSVFLHEIGHAYESNFDAPWELSSTGPNHSLHTDIVKQLEAILGQLAAAALDTVIIDPFEDPCGGE